MKPRVINLGFSALLGWQLATALINIAVARWDWVAFDLACAAIVLVSWAVTTRSLMSMKNLDRDREEKVAHYKQMLDAMRRDGDEVGERYALTMLSIWGRKGDR
jgi:hypothetical protein